MIANLEDKVMNYYNNDLKFWENVFDSFKKSRGMERAT